MSDMARVRIVNCTHISRGEALDEHAVEHLASGIDQLRSASASEVDAA
jgi:hypothetical protein